MLPFVGAVLAHVAFQSTPDAHLVCLSGLNFLLRKAHKMCIWCALEGHMGKDCPNEETVSSQYLCSNVASLALPTTSQLRRSIRGLLTFVSRLAPAAMSSMTLGASPSDDASSSRMSTGAKPAAVFEKRVYGTVDS